MLEDALKVELVPATAWWSNVRSNVSKAEWEVCKNYAKAKTRLGDTVTCIICGQSGLHQGWNREVDAHEIWEYDDEKQIQTLVDIVPLCPRCHQVKHLGHTRQSSTPDQWAVVIDHLRAVNQWPDWKVEKVVILAFQIWELRSQMEWTLDISFLDTLGIDLSGRKLERERGRADEGPVA